MSNDIIDWRIFNELILMDEDDAGFSKELVRSFIDQAQQTFQDMENSLQSRDLANLSSLGHYLKGSSSALGLHKVAYQCERIQNYGIRKNFDDVSASQPLDDDDGWCALCADAIREARAAFEQGIAYLSEYYGEKL